jgi:hypothetical protein
MKLGLLVIGLVAGPVIAKAQKKKDDTQEKPTIPDFEAFKHIPGMNDLFTQAMQDGKSEQQVDEDIRKIVESPGMMIMMVELQRKKTRGASLEELVDTAFDSVLGKRQAQDGPVKSVEELCAEACVVLKTQQCMALENTDFLVEECSKKRVQSDCKNSCML